MPKILATITHRLRTGQLGNKRAVSVAGVSAASINPNDPNFKTTYGIINLLFPIVYVSTSGISDAITLNSQQVKVDMTEFLSYFPWGVSKDEWLSCNRKGGSVQRFSTGWQDAKNVSNSPTRSHVFDRQNDWRVSEKTGKE